MRNSIIRHSAAVAAALLVLAPGSRASESDDLTALREQIRQLDQKIRVLERNQELKDETATAAAKSAPKVTAGERGFSIASGDGANLLRLRALIQADSRWYFGSNHPTKDVFLIRRARLIFEGKINKIFDYQLVPEFGGVSGNGSLTLLDANITATLKPGLQIKVGRFREPVGLEQLQSDAVAFFTERSIVSLFVPNRDIGVQVGGDLFGGTVSYALGAFNGVGDGASNANNVDINNDKDWAARIFVQPFKNEEDSALQGLGFGVAGTKSRQNGTPGSLTSGYRTDGQQSFFSYRSTTVANGDTWRLTPQGYFYYGPFGVLAEYVVSEVEASNGALQRTLRNTAWQTSVGYVLTGEKAGYNGVTPRQNFDPAAGTWGAFEIVARVAGADLDSKAFEGGSGSLANPATSAASLRSYALGTNWYLNKAVRASVNYFHVTFDPAAGVTPAAGSVIGKDEDAIVTRVQLLF